MAIETIRQVFMWCFIFNAALTIFSFVVLVGARGWVYKMHSRWIPMTEEKFNFAIYNIMGIYKILILVFNVVPYIALCIVS